MPNLLRYKWIPVIFITASCLLRTLSADFTVQCPPPCDCKWQSGNKAAICSETGLKTIPAKLSNEIQNLELSGNPLKVLPQDVIKKVGLNNLKKLILRECSIEFIHKTAFSSLGIVIEIDLSKNILAYIHPDTFKDTEKLRWINLSNNLLEKLEDNLFRNLKFLQRVELSNNRLKHIGVKSFVNLPKLQILRLDGNNLTHIKLETVNSLNYLSSLDLHNNPWLCDCNMQTFRNWIIDNNLYTKPTSCSKPDTLKDKLWIDIEPNKFACSPVIVEPRSNAVIHSYDENITLTCKVSANPAPEVYWKFNTKQIETRNFGELKYIIADNTIDTLRWVNVTVVHVKFSDRGNYTCIAVNPGGIDERNLTLIVDRIGNSNSLINSDLWSIVIGSITSVLILSAVFTLLCLYIVRKKTTVLKCDTIQSNGDVICEENGVRKLVNPVSKPPRSYVELSSIKRDLGESSELNRNLLDKEKITVATEDILQQPDLEYGNISQETLLIDRIVQDFPPDLLAFPLRLPRSILKSPNISGGFYNYSGIQGGYVTLPRRQQRINSSEMELHHIPYHIPSIEELETTPSPAPATPKNVTRISSSSPNIHNQVLAMQGCPNMYHVLNSRYTIPNHELRILLEDKKQMNGYVLRNGYTSKGAQNFRVRRRLNEFEDLCLNYYGERATQV